MKRVESTAQYPIPASSARTRAAIAALSLTGVFAATSLLCAGAAYAQTAAVAVSPSTAEAIGIQPSGLAQIQALMAEKAGRTPIQRKIASSLLYAARMANNQPIADGVRSLQVPIADDISGRSHVKIVGSVTPALLRMIASVGGTVQHAYPAHNAVYAMIDVRALEAVAALPEVLSIRRPAHVRHRTGPIDSEGDTTHNAILARSHYAVGGAGVTVGILSDSVNALGSLASSEATGEITAPVTVLQDDPSGTDEGDAMLEIVADLAPQSPLYFATADESEEGFADNIVALQQAGCTVIGDDTGYFDEPVYQDGILAQAVNEVASKGVSYFSALGNDGNVDAFSSILFSIDGSTYVDDCWEGPFLNSGYAIPGPIPATKGGAAAEVHTFDPDFGPDGMYNTVIDGDYEFVTLQWSDPFNKPTDDYDIYVLDAHGANVIASSTDIQDGGPGQEAIEQLDSENPSQSNQFALTPSDRIYIVRYNYDAVHNYPQRIFLTTDSDGANSLYFATDGDAYGHPAADGAFGVAAAPATTLGFENAYFDNLTEGPYPNLFTAQSSYENFSSAGPRTVFYDANGNYLQPNGAPVVRLKPDVTAADGVMTSLSGFNPFYGTSAATPHAAAIAALLKSHAPKLTPSEIRATLTGSALHTDTSVVPVSDIQGDWNANMGYGIVMAKAALDFTGDTYIYDVVLKSISATTATFAWQTTLPSTGALDYGTGTQSPLGLPPVACTNDPTGLMHTAALTGLTPGTTYNYRIQGTTVTGSLDLFSPTATFKTNAASSGGTPVITATSATGATLSATTVQVTVTIKDTGVGPATGAYLTAANLNGVATLTSPLPTLGTIAAGGSTAVTLTFPASAVKSPAGTGRGQQNLVTVTTKTAGSPSYSFTNPVAVTGF